MMMMYGYGGGSALGWIAMILGIVVHVAFAAMVVLAAIWLFRTLFRSGEAISGSHKADVILKQRYAKGEITFDEYQKMKQDLATM